MVPHVPLNPEAPAFVPAYQNTWPYTAIPTAPPPPPLPPTEPPCQQGEFLSLPPNFSLYLPTVPLPLPDGTNNTFLSSPPEPFVVVNEEVAVTDSLKQQRQLQFNHHGFMNIRVGPRRSYQQQHQARVLWKPKKVKEEKEDRKQQEKLYGYGYGYGYGGKKGRQDFRRSSESHGLDTSFPKKKRGSRGVSPVRENGNETTVMIKNIPSRYTRDDMVKFLENHCMVENSKVEQGFEKTDVLAFDFVYLPIDFKTGFNKGYAFVNFTTSKAAWKFNITASNGKWDMYQSQKVRQVAKAHIQGKENLEKHFENTNFPCESKEVLPVSFSVPRDGKNKSGEQKTLGVLLKPRYI
ncbi:hypothetical protein HN51_034386 [Arachis hypogaea]|uniref:Mei2-like C-terminal RNA recognition motif domain-containing protein n=1 Tax=Arachis hypogaea TaxID=3818 RepID=A0A445A8G1_ARAHY|nr:hypothetical protein Ahy_B03g068049 [Arachis hypogaea]